MTLDGVIKTHKIFKDKPWIILKKKDINIPFKKKYIEVCSYYYDDENNPDHLVWIDVEGINYGWMWCANKIRSKFELLQRRVVKKFARGLLKTIDSDTDIVAFYYDDIFVCGFIPKDNPTIYIQIRLSNKELHF